VSGPDWVNALFATAVAGVAVYSGSRLIASRAWRRPTHFDVDLAHVLMGTAMAGMFVSAVNFLPDQLWEVAFTTLGLWFVWKCYRFVGQRGIEGRDDDHVHHLSHYLTHLVMVGAMLYMYAVATRPQGPSKDAGMAMNGASGATANFVGLPLLFLVVLLASGVWELDGIGRFSPAPVEAGLAFAGPRGVGWKPGDPATTDQRHAPEGAAPAPSPVRPWLAPRLEAGCHIVMCVAMGYMLVLIL
jgi:hypothetical protein